ncbi:hypothetical protein D3C81_2003960 [compost metagenome]
MRGAERFQGFSSYNPWRDAGDKTFRKERPQWLVFPGLDIARRPVVEQAETGNVISRVTDGDRVTHLVALTDPDAQFQLVVQARARAEHRLGLTGR